MIKIENFNVDSAIIDITQMKRIDAKKMFEVDEPNLWYREIQFIDDNGRCITLRLHADKKEKLEVDEIE